jgi:hypothetical protein
MIKQYLKSLILNVLIFTLVFSGVYFAAFFSIQYLAGYFRDKTASKAKQMVAQPQNFLNTLYSPFSFKKPSGTSELAAETIEKNSDETSSNVLAASDEANSSTIEFNLPANFNKGLTVRGLKIQEKLTAPNIVYGVQQGAGIQVTNGQNPTISNTGVLTINGQSGNLTLQGGSGIRIEGTIITSTAISSLEAGAGISVNGNKITNTGVTSLEAGSGIGVSGNTISNSDKGSSQNIFKTISVSGQDNIIAGSNTDTLTIAEGSGVHLTTDSTTKTLTIGIDAAQAGVSSINSTSGVLTLAGAGINSVSVAGSTITVSGTEADTLATVTGRGASTSTNVTFSGNVNLSSLSAGGLLKVSPTTGQLVLATANGDYQTPLTAGSDYQTPLTAGIDYQTPLTANIDYQTPLVAGTDYQVPLSFGNGLVKTSNTVTVGGTLTSDIALASGGFNFNYTGTGKVGIGTISPGAKLDIYGGGLRLGAANGANDILNTSATGSAPSGYLYWGNRTLCDSTGNCAGTGAAIGGTGTTGYLSKFTGTYAIESSLIFDDDTNIGIGTALPQTKLDVNGSIGIGGTAVFDASRNLSNVAGVSTNLVPTSNDTYSLGSGSFEYDNIYGRNIYVSGNIISGGSGGGTGTIGYIQRNNGAIAPTNISDDMLVGAIATSSANVKLAASSSNTSFINGNVAIGTTSSTEKLTVGGNIAPSVDNTYNLGSSNYAWNTLYANNIIGTSFTATSSGTFKDVIISGKTNMIIDDTNLASGKDTFVYEVKKDIDGGAWISGEKVQGSSWYNETIDHPGSTCSLTSDDRCGQRAFPQKAVIVATSTTLYIYDAVDNTVWMKFSRGSGYALNGSVTLNAVFAYNGVIYVATSTNGLLAIDLINDRIYQYDYNNGSGGRAQFSGTVADRNTNKGFGSRQSWGQIASDQVNGVYARVINGKLYIAVSTLGGASVINVTDQQTVRYMD